MEVDIIRVEELKKSGVEESELDEMWSYVRSKKNPRWLWHAIDRSTGQVLAYVFGRGKDEVFLELKKLLLRLELSVTVQMLGELMSGIYQQKSMR